MLSTSSHCCPVSVRFSGQRDFSTHLGVKVVQDSCERAWTLLQAGQSHGGKPFRFHTHKMARRMPRIGRSGRCRVVGQAAAIDDADTAGTETCCSLWLGVMHIVDHRTSNSVLPCNAVVVVGSFLQNIARLPDCRE